MKDFDFKHVEDPPLAEGSLRISGLLLYKLKALDPGHVLKITGEDGRSYAIVNWEDLRKRLVAMKASEPQLRKTRYCDYDLCADTFDPAHSNNDH